MKNNTEKPQDNFEYDVLLKNRRARQMALAILNRAKEAGIPEKYLRTNRKSFENLLAGKYHKNINEFSGKVYDENLVKYNFVIIDGGLGFSNNRKIAGCAIMVLMMINDLRGAYVDCEHLRHKFQSIRSTDAILRNDLTEEHKKCDILFLSEIDKSKFTPHFESGSFFDELLNCRSDAGKPTILSFCNPVENISNKNSEQLAIEGKLNFSCGKFLSSLSFERNDPEILRVRVKS